MAQPWTLGVFFSMCLILSSACNLQPPPADCQTLPKLKATFSDVILNPEECGRFDEKTLFTNIEAVSFESAEEGKHYTFVMVDPDAPGSGVDEGWLHWILSGVKGADVKSGALTGKTLMVYAKPTPPNGTGNHRYFIYLYEETPGTTFTEVAVRRKFSLKTYAQENSFCGPVAMNMFVTVF